MHILDFHIAHLWQSKGVSFVIATVIDTAGSTPRLQGSQMIINQEEFYGSIGGGTIEYEVIQAARQIINHSNDNIAPSPKRFIILNKHLSHDLGMCCGGKMSILLQAYIPSPRLWIYGAGHIATALAQQAALLDFPCTIVDARAEWANNQRFPKQIEVCCEDICEEIRLSPPQVQDFAFVCTHDHVLDEDIMTLLLTKSLRYLALIGSRRKWAQFKKRLQAKGINESRLAEVSCPAGLSINAQTPAEIAISIMAEIIQRKAEI
jgi:xanthine dehydrogenase accessory factor